MTTQENGFNEYKRLLLHRLEEQKEELIRQREESRAEHAGIRADMAKLSLDFETFKATEKAEHRIKASLWGAVGAVLPVALGLFVFFANR